MILCRYNYEKSGIIENGIVKEVSGIEANELTPTGEEIPAKDARFLPPSAPSKVVCVGLNYIDHARELEMEIPKEPIIFLKPPSAVIGHGDKIIYPAMSRQVDYEAELAVVIGKKCRDVKRDCVDDVILGYSAFNDVTARDLQRKDGQWTRAKGFDTFAPYGPYIVTKDEVGDPDDLDIRLFLNGKKMQDSNTKKFIFDIPYLVEFISHIMTLNPGDVIATGTPPGIGSMLPGDVVEVKIENIGVLKNRVVG